jgi:hypothetical protein
MIYFLIGTFDNPSESLLEWYKNLKDAAGINTYIETNNARR